MLTDKANVEKVDYFRNGDLLGLSPLECLDAIVAYCGIINLRVILDRHSSLADGSDQESFWYLPGDPYYTEQRVIDDWVMLASRYKGTAVIGADLWNEPKYPCSWGSGNKTTDWNKAAERIGNAILGVNTDWLLFVAGVNYAYDVSGAASHPIQLSVRNKVISIYYNVVY